MLIHLLILGKARIVSMLFAATAAWAVSPLVQAQVGSPLDGHGANTCSLTLDPKIREVFPAASWENIGNTSDVTRSARESIARVGAAIHGEPPFRQCGD